MNKKIKLGYDDVSIVPEVISRIRHRKECCCYQPENYTLPIFAAPMDGVVDEESANIFMDNSINVVIPRTLPLDKRLHLLMKNYSTSMMFIAFSLTEVQEIFLTPINNQDPALLLHKPFSKETIRQNLISEFFSGSYRICIDIANGHMTDLLDTIKAIKDTYGSKVIVMSGNIANPETYRKYVEVGCDFVRCSIGSGSRCVCAGTKIRMSNGELKNIEDVAIGDLVKTTDGDFEVINTFNKCTDKTILINNNIECTHDHKFLVVRKTDIPITGIISDDKIKEISFYIEAEKLTDDYLLVSE